MREETSAPQMINPRRHAESVALTWKHTPLSHCFPPQPSLLGLPLRFAIQRLGFDYVMGDVTTCVGRAGKSVWIHPLGSWKQGWECPQRERERTAQEHWLKANRAGIAVFRNLLPNHAAYWLHSIFTTVLWDINDSCSTAHEGEFA